MKPSNDDNDFANNVFENMNKLFFNPEIAKRKEHNLLPSDFTLIAAQAILFPDGRPHIVRLNNEVAAEVKIRKGIDKTEEGFWPLTTEIEHIKLIEEKFLNCGHVTMILFKDGFQLSFDFSYNKQICAEHLRVAWQFLQTSQFALQNDFVFACIDNSFSAIELLAKTNLLAEADKNMHGKTTHKTIKAAFNIRHRNAQTQFDIDRRQIFNRLSDVRKVARYLEGNFFFNKSELESIIKTIQEMHNELCVRVDFNDR